MKKMCFIVPAFVVLMGFAAAARGDFKSDILKTPEMKALQNIDCAFLPMNMPYTMTPAMVADAAKAFKPEVLYPYHYDFGETDTSKLVELMKDTTEIDTRIWKTK